ncbi:MAG: pyocin knob domain-containing protein [Coriobacteriia bacterium]|nr:pyocin knob domain-containing protein [Coriobacteriia bacterium]
MDDKTRSLLHKAANDISAVNNADNDKAERAGLKRRSGTVTAINADGSLKVRPDGFIDSIPCGRACNPSVGDRVVILVDKTQWTAVAVVGGETSIKALGPAETINCSMATLQATLNALPKYLDHNVTINVTSGTITSNIVVQYFQGPGYLLIYCVDASGATINTAGVQTHKCGRVTIQYCTNPMIYLYGLTATSADNSCFYAYRNTCSYIFFAYCNAVSGTPTNSASIGINASYGSQYVRASACTISNMYYAVASTYGSTVGLAATAGLGNNILYRAIAGGNIRIESKGTISGATPKSLATGATYSEVTADFSTIETIGPYGENIPNGTDLNTITEPGVYYTSSGNNAATLVNAPDTGAGCYMVVDWTQRTGTGNRIRQKWQRSTAGYLKHWERYSGDSGATWSAWWVREAFQASTNINPTSGWVWVQYASGIAECWREATGSAVINTVWENGWRRTASVIASTAFPFTFAQIPTSLRWVEGNSNTRALFLMTTTATTTSGTGTFYLAENRSVADTASVGYRLHEHYIGRLA